MSRTWTCRCPVKRSYETIAGYRCHTCEDKVDLSLFGRTLLLSHYLIEVLEMTQGDYSREYVEAALDECKRICTEIDREVQALTAELVVRVSDITKQGVL